MTKKRNVTGIWLLKKKSRTRKKKWKRNNGIGLVRKQDMKKIKKRNVTPATEQQGRAQRRLSAETSVLVTTTSTRIWFEKEKKTRTRNVTSATRTTKEEQRDVKNEELHHHQHRQVRGKKQKKASS